jgi:putative tryptophan/tyrosine transport system permease protein
MKNLVIDTLITGLPLTCAVIGIWMIFRLREDFDLTVDASFATGAAITATMLAHGGSVPIAMFVGVLASGAMGFITATLHLLLKIPVILAGVVMSIGFYSVDLAIMGTPTVSLVGVPTLFSGFDGLSRDGSDLATIGVMAAIALVALVALGFFLRTEIGLALRASGVNERMTRSQGVNVKALLYLSLFCANALAGLSGAVLVQSQGFADVSMGSGTLIAGIGAVLLGELVLRPRPSRLARTMVALLVGVIAYQLILVGSLRLGLPAADLKGVTALTLVTAIAAERFGRPLFAGLRRHTQIGVFPAGAATERE